MVKTETDNSQTQSKGKLVGTEENPLVVKPEKPFEKPEILVEWQGYARRFKDREPAWYVGVALTTLIAIGILAFMQQWTFLLAVGAFAFLLISINLVEPRTKTYKIATTGVWIKGKRTGYEDLKWFWLEGANDNSQHTTLYISTYLRYPHVLEMPLPLKDTKQLEEQLEEALLKYLPYHEEGGRNWLNSFDNFVYQIEEYLPSFLVNWYRGLNHS